MNWTDLAERIMIRTSSGRRPATRQEILRLFLRSESAYYDEFPVMQATIDDLDRHAIADFFEQIQGQAWDEIGLTYERVLMNWRLMLDEEAVLRPTVAGLLFFGLKPQRFMPNAYVSAIRIPGTDLSLDPSDQKRIDGPLRTIYEDTMRFLNIHLPVRHEIVDAESELRPDLPLNALREAVVNALAHRDYTIQGPIRVIIFDDRVEIRSPGRLPNSINLDSLSLGLHVARNPIIYSLFARAGLATSAGSGFLRMIRLMRDTVGLEPSWQILGPDFVVTFPRSNK